MRRRTIIAVVSILMLAALIALPAHAGIPGDQSLSVRGSGGIASPPGAFYPIQLPEFDGSFYEILDDPGISWDDAMAAVEAMDFRGCYSHLVTITSQDEQDALYEFFEAGLQGKWYGGFQDPGVLVPDEGWNWVTGEPWVYTNWAPGEPNDAYGPGTEGHLLGWDAGWAWNDEGNLDNVTGYAVEHEDCDPGPMGPATFSFNIRNQLWGGPPAGSVLFRLPSAGMTFRATQFDFLILDGPFAVTFGRGSVNGVPGYEFWMWVQEDLQEEFYIFIYDPGSGPGMETVVYTTFEPLPVTAGYIAIHAL